MNFNVEGKITYKMIDTRTDEVVLEGGGSNLSLMAYLESYFLHGTPLLSEDMFHKLYLGDSTTAADRSQAGLQGAELGSVNPGIIIEKSEPLGTLNYKLIKAEWEVPAGVATGTINEMYLESNANGNWNNTPIARKVLTSPVTKESYHSIFFTWEIRINKNGYMKTGTIVDGSKEVN